MPNAAPEQSADVAADLDVAVGQAIEACGGDPVAAVRALLVVNEALELELAALYARSSHGYLRGRRVRWEGNSS